MTIVATGFLFFVYFFDWIIYGQNKFTLVQTAEKKECKSRSLPVTRATFCSAQDLNTRVKFKVDDSYFVVDTTYSTSDTSSTHCQPLCLETENIVTEVISSRKMIRSIQLGRSNVLLERPYGESIRVPPNRLVA